MKHIKKFNESYIIGSDPIEATIKLKEKLKKIISELEIFEEHVIKELDDNETNDYTTEIYDITKKIAGLSNDVKIDDLEISLSDFNNKF
jgi:hypothetical protein